MQEKGVLKPDPLSNVIFPGMGNGMAVTNVEAPTNGMAIPNPQNFVNAGTPQKDNTQDHPGMNYFQQDYQSPAEPQVTLPTEQHTKEPKFKDAPIPLPGLDVPPAGPTVVIDNERVEIDKRFVNLPPEVAVFRTYKSKFDQLTSAQAGITKANNELKEKASLVDLMRKEPDMIKAFVAEIAPELKFVGEGDRIKETLDAEFGKDFETTKYNDEEAYKKPSSQSAKYLRRLSQLENESRSGNNKSGTTVKEILQRETERINAQMQEQEEKINKVKTTYNVSDKAWGEFETFAKYLSSNVDYFYEVFTLLKSFQNSSQTAPPSINMIPGNTRGQINTADPYVNAFQQLVQGRQYL